MKRFNIYRYTRGYPFLVSKICKVIDENLDKDWTVKGIEEAVKIILNEDNTLFKSLIKNIENNQDTYELVYALSVEGSKITFNRDAYEKEIMYGIIDRNSDNTIRIHNTIFELRIYNYLIAKRERSKKQLLTYNRA